jgi:hypothetical protein
MGMSTHVIGLISSDDKVYQKHKKVVIACIGAGIKELPKETAEFFGDKTPSEYVLREKLEREVPHKEWGDDGRSGFEINVKDIPKEITRIRFYNSW